jgi:hypothetical protein
MTEQEEIALAERIAARCLERGQRVSVARIRRYLKLIEWEVSSGAEAPMSIAGE